MKENKTTKFFNPEYFNFFKKLVGSIPMAVYVILNFLVGFLDGLGLAMFVPLLSIATGTQGDEQEQDGKLTYIIELFNSLGIELNLVNTLALMILLFIIKGIIYYIKAIYFTHMRIIALKKVRLGLITNLGNTSYEGFTKIDAGRIQSNMVGETQKLMNSLTQYFNTIQNIVMLLTYVGLAFIANWKFALMVGVGGFVTNLLYNFVNTYTKDNSKKISYLGYDFNGNLIQTLHNFKYLKATNYYKVMNFKLQGNIKKSEEISYKLARLGSIAESLREPLIIIIIAFVIIIQVEWLGSDFTNILVSLLLFYRALSYLVTMQNSWNSFLASSAGLDSIQDLNKEFSNYKEPYFKDQILNIDDILVKNASVTYDNKKVLNNINLIIQKNTSIAFVGESGAGKTTLANVICGLIAPHEGEVITNNKNIYKTNIKHFREKVGYITQEPVIFNDTIFNNVSFWQDKNPENLDKFVEVMKLVSLEKFIDGFTEKEDAPLGDNGVLISGGQKQRISIARELYKNVDLLIMDEATSALDSETEKFIKDNIDLLHGKFSMIIIAHRLSTIKNVDVIYLLDNGMIIDYGSYDQLLKTSVRFRKMVELQQV